MDAKLTLNLNEEGEKFEISPFVRIFRPEIPIRIILMAKS